MTDSPNKPQPISKAEMQELFAKHGEAVIRGCYFHETYSEFEDGSLVRPNTKSIRESRYFDHNDDTVCLIFEYTRRDDTVVRVVRCLRVNGVMYFVPL